MECMGAIQSQLLQSASTLCCKKKKNGAEKKKKIDERIKRFSDNKPVAQYFNDILGRGPNSSDKWPGAGDLFIGSQHGNGNK